MASAVVDRTKRMRFTKDNIRKVNNGNGVYKIFDKNGKLVYVGRASNGNVKHHLTQHFGSRHYSGARFGEREDHQFQIVRTKGPRQAKELEERIVTREKPKGNVYRTPRLRAQKLQTRTFANRKKPRPSAGRGVLPREDFTPAIHVVRKKRKKQKPMVKL